MLPGDKQISSCRFLNLSGLAENKVANNLQTGQALNLPEKLVTTASQGASLSQAI